MAETASGLLGFITKDVVKLELTATSKKEAIRELTGLLVEAGKVTAGNQKKITEAILAREELGSTGIGNGLAIPHAKASPLVEDMIGAFGRSTEGIEFGASDGEVCKLFFLMISPEDGVQEHLQILRKIASLGRNDHFLKFLERADSADEVLSIFREVEDA
ncbi:MAG: PTS sugar transporter subunit IIA [Planctomycetota bacterium]